MKAFFEWHDAVIAKSRWASPNHHVAVGNWNSNRLVSALLSTVQKDRRKTERNRNDWLLEISLILVLMQREPCAGLIAIDEAGVWNKSAKACFLRCTRRPLTDVGTQINALPFPN